MPLTIPTRDRGLRVAFVLLPDFPLMAYAAAVEPLRAVNVLAGCPLYEWRHASVDGAAVQASQGLSVTPDAALAELGASADRLFVCAGGNPSGFSDERLFTVLRRFAATRPGTLGGISGGPFVLARAGLLDGIRCTLHWEHIPAFRETFPRALVRRSLYEIDRDRITCAGGIAALDMMLELVSRDGHRDLAPDVGAWFLHDRMREGASPQEMPFPLRFPSRDPRISRALKLIDDNLDRTLDRCALARHAGLSERQLERLVKAVTGHTPHDYGLRQRLAHAHRLLRETVLSRAEVAQLAGFASTAELRRVEKRYSGRGG